jgi:hypothetical protein
MPLRNQSETEAVREGLADRHDLQEETTETMEEQEQEIVGRATDQGLADLAHMYADEDALSRIYRADTLQGLKTETGEQFTNLDEYKQAVSELGDLTLLEQDMARSSELIIEERIKQTAPLVHELKEAIKIHPDEPFGQMLRDIGR